MISTKAYINKNSHINEKSVKTWCLYLNHNLGEWIYIFVISIFTDFNFGT